MKGTEERKREAGKEKETKRREEGERRENSMK